MAQPTAGDIWAPVVDQPFDEASYTKELEGNNKEIKFEKGSKTVKVRTITTAGTLTNHDKTKTFSAQIAGIANVQSTDNTYTLDQEKDIQQFLDRVVASQNNSIKEGGKVLHAIVAEQLVPTVDAYRLAVLSGVAISTGQKVTPTSDGMADWNGARAYLVNARLFKNVVGYINTTASNAIRSSGKMDPFTNGLEKTLRTGDIGMLGGVKVKEVPSDLLPTNVRAVLVNPAVVSAPRFLDDAKVGESAAAFGQLILGLYLYTCVVSVPKQKGVAIIGSATSV